MAEPSRIFDSAPSGLRFVVGSSFNRRASPCAIDIALSGLSLWHTLNKKSSEGATSTAQGGAL